VLLSLRTLLIWSANLAVYYSNDGGDVGEHWDRDASPVQCAGFVLLLLGTLLYAQGSSAVTRDTKSIVTDIQGIYRALSVRSSLDLPWPDLQLAQAASAREHSNQQGVTGSAVPVSPQWRPRVAGVVGEDDGDRTVAAARTGRPAAGAVGATGPQQRGLRDGVGAAPGVVRR